ncbi:MULTISPECIES: orange carotenoid protein N-terminal domain-containing protein [Cyanophyceae]|uniref:Orange carotenoid protein n=2 Tax=Cyanophyceae TaxID=3028117 RepID=A0A4Q7E080_9CYAN|nr:MULTISPECIES: orange carotenoid protein N-terminal domain-containing protein [Cyanophyceae]MCM1983018.1 Orange carotenoid protein [Lyngbya confervoides BDU141951]RZM74743.1 Orange carotenoid protein [Leptolyngbya sp. LK]
MTTFSNAVNNLEKACKIFRGLSVDDQLAWLWFVYRKMGQSITPAAPGAAAAKIAEGLYEQVKQQSKQDQLAAMRAIAHKDPNNLISREYGSLSTNTKLAFWYALAIGMDRGEIIAMPDNYEFSQQGQELLAAIETLDFEAQITLLRNAVEPMGAAPRADETI